MASSAIAGIQSANLQMDRAAQTVADSGARAADTVSISSGAYEPHESDDVSALVDMRMARYQLAAQVSVLHTADDATQDLLDIVKR